MREECRRILIKAMRREAEKSVNNACGLFCYQPKESAAVLKLKKKQKS